MRKTNFYDILILKHNKRKIIILGLLPIAHNVSFLVLYHENKNKIISITHRSDIDFRTTTSNNPMCAVLHLMNSTLRGPLL